MHKTGQRVSQKVEITNADTQIVKNLDLLEK